MNPVECFARLVRGPEEATDLAQAALAVAAGGDRGVEPRIWLAELDRMAAGVSGLDGLRTRLFVEAGFTGNTADYYDPDNSFLHRVLQRRLGIPLTLSIVAIEVGARAGVTLEGIAMPGHFLVRDAALGQYLDPFHGGAILDERGAEARFRDVTGAGPGVTFGPHLLPSVGTRGILARMLENLRTIYRNRASPADLEWVLRMRLLLPRCGAGHITELGEALALQGRIREGAAEIEAHAAGRDDERELLTAARSLRARLN